MCCNIETCVFKQYEEKSLKKEESRDEEENEDDGSTANEEYDPMEAEDADEDEEDGMITLFDLLLFYYLVSDEKPCTTLSM